MQKKGHNSAKFWRWLLISNLTCILQWYILLQTFNKINPPCKSYWSKLIAIHQQKLSWKRAITQPKFGRWLPISNLTCILQWYKVLQILNEINASLQKLLSGNKQQNIPSKVIEQKRTTKTKSNKRTMMVLYRSLEQTDLHTYCWSFSQVHCSKIFVYIL